MRSRQITYLIAEVLYYKYGTGVDILQEQIEKEISMIAGDDPRTFHKYKENLVKDGYIVVTSLLPNLTWKISKKPVKPPRPSEYLHLIKTLHEKEVVRI